VSVGKELFIISGWCVSVWRTLNIALLWLLTCPIPEQLNLLLFSLLLLKLLLTWHDIIAAVYSGINVAYLGLSGNNNSRCAFCCCEMNHTVQLCRCHKCGYQVTVCHTASTTH